MKPDSAQIVAFLRDLEQQEWIRRSERRWWPRYLFHYTDIQNTVRILESGHLYSRQHATDTGSLVVSSGSDTVLSATRSDIKGYVRLYFRPKTPTQYHAEGIRSKQTLSASKFPDAHCPVPVFFLFSSEKILALDNCRFSDRNLAAANPQVFSTAAELSRLDWKSIYHNGPVDPFDSDRSEIIHKRMAEVVVPDSLDLSALRWLYCRSEAEKETLLCLLPEPLRSQYLSRIVATSRSDLFFRKHTFIESVRLASEHAVVSFSPDTDSAGPFLLEATIESGGEPRRLSAPNFSLNKFTWKIDTRTYERYTLEIRLDGWLAYRNSYHDIEIPF
jgi:hypothetical protein